MAELLVSKGADESARSVDDEVPKDRIAVFKRREELKKKRNAMKRKLRTLQKLLQAKKDTDVAAKRAPVVQRSRLVRAAAVGKTDDLENLLGKDKTDCVVDEFEVNCVNTFRVYFCGCGVCFLLNASKRLCVCSFHPHLCLRILHVQVYGLNALHVAAKLGHTRFVEALLEKKASPNARVRRGKTRGSFASLRPLRGGVVMVADIEQLTK